MIIGFNFLFGVFKFLKKIRLQGLCIDFLHLPFKNIRQICLRASPEELYFANLQSGIFLHIVASRESERCLSVPIPQLLMIEIQLFPGFVPWFGGVRHHSGFFLSFEHLPVLLLLHGLLYSFDWFEFVCFFVEALL